MKLLNYIKTFLSTPGKTKVGLSVILWVIILLYFKGGRLNAQKHTRFYIFWSQDDIVTAYFIWKNWQKIAVFSLSISKSNFQTLGTFYITEMIFFTRKCRYILQSIFFLASSFKQLQIYAFLTDQWLSNLFDRKICVFFIELEQKYTMP